MASISGTAGNNFLVGTAESDVLNGMAGNDTMTGGTGADDFIFFFGDSEVAGGSSSFDAFLEDNDLEDDPGAVNYRAWLDSLLMQFALGADLDADGEVAVEFVRDGEGNVESLEIEGMTAAEVDAVFSDGFDGFTIGDRMVYTGNGQDVITDFDGAAGDRIVVNGLTEEAVFTVQVTDVDGDGEMDTQFGLLSDPTWGLTLLGYDSFDVGRDVIVEGGADIVGTAGDDLLVGTVDADVILGLGGDDTIEGGGGDDTMTGGDGADHFVFRFGQQTVEGGVTTFADWLESEGRPAMVDGVTTQSQFIRAYNDWLEYIVDTYSLGFDEDMDGRIEVGSNQNDELGVPHIEGMSEEEADELFGDPTSIDVVTGNHTTERFFAGSFQVDDQVIFTGNGADVITDFDADEGDMLVVSGLEAIGGAAFTLTVLDVNGDGVADTRFYLTSDGTWSVDLLGVSDFSVLESVQVV